MIIVNDPPGSLPIEVEQGATLLLDGRGYVNEQYPEGNFVGPTIVADVTPEMDIYREEVFGPV